MCIISHSSDIFQLSNSSAMTCVMMVMMIELLPKWGFVGWCQQISRGRPTAPAPPTWSSGWRGWCRGRWRQPSKIQLELELDIFWPYPSYKISLSDLPNTKKGDAYYSKARWYWHQPCHEKEKLLIYQDVSQEDLGGVGGKPEPGWMGGWGSQYVV